MERIDPDKIPLIHELAKQHGNSFRKELALIVKRGVTAGWIKPKSPVGSPVERGSDKAV